MIKKITLLLILLFAIAMRLPSFWESKVDFHAFGDTKSYLGSALKLEKRGFSGYNLHGIDYYTTDGFFALKLVSQAEGNLLKERNKDGFCLDNQPLFFSPPAFSCLLALSHQVFAGDSPYQIKIIEKGRERFSWETVRKQFYAALIPFLCSIITLGFVYILGSWLFTGTTALLAVLFMAVSPVEIGAAYKILPDTMLMCLSAATVLFFYCALVRKSTLYFCCAAITFSLALLTKNSAVVLGVVIVFISIILKYRLITFKDNPQGAFFDLKRTALFCAIVFLSSASWYMIVFKYYHVFFYNPTVAGISTVHPFFKWINERPWYTWIVDIPYQNPVFLFSYCSIGFWFFRKIKEFNVFLLMAWILSFYVFLTAFIMIDEMTGPDNRYMLPVYPALSLLAADFLLRMIKKLSVFFPRKIILWCAILFVTFSVLWSLNITVFALAFKDEFIALPF